MSTKKNKTFELEVLEELFIDQLEFKIQALLLLLKIAGPKKEELLSYIEQIDELTQENLTLLTKNHD